MMEVMRILRSVYPNPKRTILAGHWNGEEQGLNGSRAFADDHPEIVSGLQVLLNHDDGTGRIDRITMEGIVGAGAYFRSWIGNIPEDLTREITLVDPGAPGRGETDNWSFVCAGAPAFGLNSASWDYGVYTWHTNRDTYDKLVTDALSANATLIAMLAYLASEEPDRIPAPSGSCLSTPLQASPPSGPSARIPTGASSAETVPRGRFGNPADGRAPCGCASPGGQSSQSGQSCHRHRGRRDQSCGRRVGDAGGRLPVLPHIQLHRAGGGRANRSLSPYAHRARLPLAAALRVRRPPGHAAPGTPGTARSATRSASGCRQPGRTGPVGAGCSRLGQRGRARTVGVLEPSPPPRGRGRWFALLALRIMGSKRSVG